LGPQHHRERRPAALAALNGHASAVSERQLAHQPQAQAQAAAARGRRVLVTLEDPEPVGGRDPHALVGDGDAHPGAAHWPHRHPHRAALAELERVGEQVGDDLLDGGRVPPAVHGMGRQIDRDALGAGEGGEQALDGRAHGDADVQEPRPEQRAPAALKLHHGVDERLQALDLRAHDAQRGRDNVAG